jgi:hypothetical protein
MTRGDRAGGGRMTPSRSSHSAVAPDQSACSPEQAACLPSASMGKHPCIHDLIGIIARVTVLGMLVGRLREQPHLAPRPGRYGTRKK